MLWDEDMRKKFGEKLRSNSLLGAIFAHCEQRRKWIDDDAVDVDEYQLDCMSPFQEYMRTALTEEYHVLAEPTELGCCRQWICRIIMVRAS